MVTPTRRAECMQGAPKAVSTITGAQLEETAVNDFSDIAGRTPGPSLRSGDEGNQTSHMPEMSGPLGGEYSVSAT